MSHRVHRHLDGELPLAALSQEDRQEVEEYRALFRGALRPLLEQDVPDVSASVMSAIRSSMGEQPETHLRDSAWTLGTAWAWLWRPRVVVLRARPAWGLALAIAAAFLVIRPAMDVPPAVPVQMGGTVMAASAADGQVVVLFRLDAPGARSVQLAGDFTDWKAVHALTEVSPGVWSAAVPIEVGIHDYAFVVDDTDWVRDPLAESVDDGFGGSNSRVAVLLPGQGEEA